MCFVYPEALFPSVTPKNKLECSPFQETIVLDWNKPRRRDRIIWMLSPIIHCFDICCVYTEFFILDAVAYEDFWST